MSMIHCADCAFYREEPKQDLAESVSGQPAKGQCYRHPPHVQLIQGQNPISGEAQMGTFPYRPSVFGTDGCGDGESRPPILAK